MKIKQIFYVSLFIFFAFLNVQAANLTTDYGKHLAKIVDDVVKTIHATVPKSYITHADVLAIMCVEQRSLQISNDSHVGAKGLTQVMPATFRTYYNSNRHGFRDFVNRTKCTDKMLSQDPRCSIEAGARIFDDLLVRYNGDRNMAAGAYHGGPGSVISKTQYKGSLTTKYATQWYPACFNKVKNGQAPASTEVWRALVSEVSRITGGTFGLQGVASELVNYIAGSDNYVQNVLSEQPENQNSLFGSLKSKWNSWWGESDADGSNSYSRGNTSSANKAPGGVNDPDTFFGTKDNSVYSGTLTDSKKINPSTVDGSTPYFGQDGFLYCLPKTVEKGEPFLIAYACPPGLTAESDDFDLQFDAAVKTHSILDNLVLTLTCRNSERVINYNCSIKVAKPQIVTFDVTPATAPTGETVTVKWKTKDMSSCILKSLNGSFKRHGTEGLAYFKKINNKEQLILYCKSENGLSFSKSLEI